MATINHGSGADIIVPSSNGTTYRGLAGDDTYIISNSIAANASVTIVDTSGANTIQLVDGLSVKSSKGNIALLLYCKSFFLKRLVLIKTQISPHKLF